MLCNGFISRVKRRGGKLRLSSVGQPAARQWTDLIQAAAISAISRCQTNNWILTFISRLDTGHLLHWARSAGPSILQTAYYQHYYFIYYFYSLDMTGDMIVAWCDCACSCRIHGFAPEWMYPCRVTVTSESKICADLCCVVLDPLLAAAGPTSAHWDWYCSPLCGVQLSNVHPIIGISASKDERDQMALKQSPLLGAGVGVQGLVRVWCLATPLMLGVTAVTRRPRNVRS